MIKNPNQNYSLNEDHSMMQSLARSRILRKLSRLAITIWKNHTLKVRFPLNSHACGIIDDLLSHILYFLLMHA